MQATIRDVAQKAGVSIKTVSRVINDEPFVRPEMRQRVLQAVEALGYAANLSARRLASGRAYTVGLVFHQASWYYILDVQKSILETLTPAGYTLALHPLHSLDDDAEDVIQLAARKAVDGLIFAPPADHSHRLLHTLSGMGVPFVRLTPSDRRLAAPYVSASDRAGASEMTRHLLALGHHRIGFVYGPSAQFAAAERYQGFREALAEAGLSPEPGWIVQGDDQFDSGLAAGKQLLGLEQPPTAIFANNDEMAAGVLAQAHLQGIPVPQLLSVAGFDDVPLARQLWPPLTTVHQPIAEIASTAAGILLSMLAGEPPAALENEIPTTLIVRGSTGPAPDF
jgi:LacI family transcriptional regulator